MNSCYRAILGISLLDHLPNSELYKRIDQRPLVETIRQRQLRWLGHALRRNETDPAKVFAMWEPEVGHSKAKMGRHKLSWRQYVAGFLAPYRVGLTTKDIEGLVQDRKRLQKIVAVCSSAASE